MNCKKALLAIFLMLLLTHQASAQQIDSLLTSWTEQRPTEKIYIQFDNKHYLPGQTVWFKAYLMSGFERSDLSKNFYLDFYDANGKLLEHSARPIVYGSCWGSFIVPANYKAETIQTVAYTKWMRNFDSTYFFRQQLSIIPAQAVVKKTTTALPNITVQFLPEAGNVIANIPAIIAFKAMNQLGLPESISGAVKNNAGEEVATFSTVHDGMGKFYYLPISNETYTAEWKDAMGSIHQTPIPVAQPVGIALNVEYGKLDRVFHIQRSPSIPEAWKKITVVAQMNGQVLFKAVANLANKESITSRIPVSQFPSGILQVTLFDINNQPVAERLLFINNQEYTLNAKVYLDSLHLGKREKSSIEIEVNDSTISNMSLAITDGESNGEPDNTIVSQLLLRGDLKGYIHQPAYYFTSDEDSVLKNLDLVMLTNGWRRYNWQEILQAQRPKKPFLKDTSFLSLVGKIDRITEAKIKKAAMINLILAGKDSSKSLMFLPLNTDGSFSQNNLLLFDTAKVYYKLNGTDLSWKSSVDIKNDLLSADTNKVKPVSNYIVDTTGYAHLQFIASAQKRLEILKMQTTLKEVVVKSKIKSRVQELNEKYATGLFSHGDGFDFDMENEIVGGASVLEYLQSRVPGLTINNANSPDATASWRGSTTSLFINEFQSDAQQVFATSINDIAYIKVLRPPFFGGFGGGAGGAIAIYTKKGVDATRSMKGMDFVMLPGYAPVREFFEPNYDAPQINFGEPDNRNTLLWSATIRTDRHNKKAKLFFFNNDITHSFRIVLEGMDNEGKLLHYSTLVK